MCKLCNDQKMFPRFRLFAGMSATAGLVTVHAASTDGESAKVKPNTAAHRTEKKTIRASQLPIYEEPKPVQFEVVEEKPSAYYTAISDARKWVWTYTDTIQGTTNRVKDIVNTSVQHSKDALQYIQQDSGVLPRAVVISVSGLGGIVAGYRGGFFRKTGYATVAMFGAAAICYPNEAIAISKKGWKEVRSLAVNVYKENVASGKEKEKKNETVVKKPVSQKTPPGEVTKTPVDEKKEKATKSGDSTVKKDFGMSNPEDKDMYTTRGK